MSMTEDEMARRIHETHAAPTADIPLEPARPASPVGQHPAFEQPCDAPGCHALTTAFAATRDHQGHSQIIHFCPAHIAWAQEAAQLEGWWPA